MEGCVAQVVIFNFISVSYQYGFVLLRYSRRAFLFAKQNTHFVTWTNRKVPSSRKNGNLV